MPGQGTRPASGPALWDRLVRTPGPEVVGPGGANRLVDLPSYSYLARGPAISRAACLHGKLGNTPQGEPGIPRGVATNASPYRCIQLLCSTASCCETRRPPLLHRGRCRGTEGL